MLVLALESSCDECSAAAVEDGRVLGECTRTQTIHQAYGGVVPELAGRSHLELVDGITAQALRSANRELSQIDWIAATVGPGLVGALLVGANYARGLALALNKPFYPIHHIEAHFWSAEIESGELECPFLVLLVSGGHTLLLRVDGLRNYLVIGSTLDDALGEAYDKVGKLAGFFFPAGADVDRMAAMGDKQAFRFPNAMDDGSMNFSFSGLKTSFLYQLRKMSPSEQQTRKADLLASFQEAALESVIRKVRRAIENTAPRAIVTAGGVAANSVLRNKLKSAADAAGISCKIPSPRYCMDNASMVAYLGWKLVRSGIPPVEGHIRPRWPIDELISK